MEKKADLTPLCKGPPYKYCVKRPVCQACQQRPCAINYVKDVVVHYRSRCENCIRKKRGIKKRRPLWESAGYKKKTTCDRCGFRARYTAQLMVYHVDGKLDNCEYKNLKTICQNCVVEITRSDLPWRRGDLEPDV